MAKLKREDEGWMPTNDIENDGNNAECLHGDVT